jgi:DNA-binding MarR family transcriptional regulator
MRFDHMKTDLSIDEEEEQSYTEKQGQYLAFIFYYTKINGVPPAQIDLQRYFAVTPPTIHQMILQLEKKGLISRTPNTARSLKLRISEEQLPRLK